MDLLDSKEKQDDEIPKTVNEEEEDLSVLSAFLLRSSQIFSAALNAAIELNLFDIIAEEGGGRRVSASEVASRLPSSSQHRDLALRIDRLLRLLASHSLLSCSVRENEDGDTERVYAISSIGKHLVSGSLGFVPIFSHPALMQAWVNFKDAIIDEDNDLFKKIHGMPMYQYAKTDPTWNKTFNKAMANVCNIEMRRILEIYKGFEGISTLVDVGGGTGQNLKMIVSKYPSIKGINFDLPQVIQNAPSLQGIEHVGGDMFESVPKGDAIILKAVCHNWSDENSIKVLKKCHEALPEKGKVIVVEFIMPEAIRETEEAKYVSILDTLMFLHDGRERTEKEFQSLCLRSGFSSFSVASRAFSVLGVMEFCK
ncbi:isoliquiritigenin 2'-O-methyltransferase-like [Prosopis cineraria]|uniref:isoliquiritigenin 2'-O-methyltransferase-like n=1 Tax=Prosopis cineraria TaxID=364024 RepID=UPI00240EF3D5|nr:isoliquiritigenin 2'-O-methyltransferase-like [Prosopis cineraria]